MNRVGIPTLGQAAFAGPFILSLGMRGGGSIPG